MCTEYPAKECLSIWRHPPAAAVGLQRKMANCFDSRGRVPPPGAGRRGIISSSKSDLQFIIFGFNNFAPFLTFQDQNWFPHKFISHLRSDKILVSWETSVILNILNVKLSGFLRKYFCHSKTITVAMLKLVGRKYGDVVLTFSGKSAGWCYFQRAP